MQKKDVLRLELASFSQTPQGSPKYEIHHHRMGSTLRRGG